ncbi:MAG TPA: bifunctional UDP-sugar hydrolase/5'-nucleotidase [Anaerolineales bacterium]|jgi:2',3'-cyclic-nucleotide 2'-phosphodiesterase (5'-nucleotidase family)
MASNDGVGSGMSRRGFLRLLPPLLLAGCSPWPGGLGRWRETARQRRLHLLYTNDEHGWMQPTATHGGAASLLHRWRQRHGLFDGSHHLLLSGGDMWTGPAISTSLDGQSMADIMNRMGYAAAAIGNHDFDFGPDVLRARAAQSSFPFLTANVKQRGTDLPPDFAQAYSLHTVNGIRLGLVGLTTIETPIDTRPSYAEGYDFWRYDQALPPVLEQVWAEGADLVIIVGHVCNRELEQLAPLAADYGAGLLTGGHCHEEHNEQVAGVHLIESGYFLRGYVSVDMLVDLDDKQPVSFEASVLPNPPGAADHALAERIEFWRQQLDPQLFRPVGFTAKGIDRSSPWMDRLLTDAWLQAVPEAQIALASRRYVQQSLPAGSVTPASVVGLLPVANVLMIVQLTGAQLVDTIRSRRPVLGGAEVVGDVVRLVGGAGVEAETVYTVVVPDVIYYGANRYNLQAIDPHARDTGIDWRRPVVEYLEGLATSADRPLEQVLAG